MKNTNQLYLGVELGSTRIKSVLIDGQGDVKALGTHTWENRLENGLWTYSEQDIHTGFQASISDLVHQYGGIPDISALGISGMMHGYIALDQNGDFLAPFLTWRNTNAERAANALTHEFGVNVPMRWSISQLYQAILNGEEHVKSIAHLTTLSGYIHYQLTGNFVLGIGDASGVFPIDSTIQDYDQNMLDQFDKLIAHKHYPWKIRDILPKVLCAGTTAGALTAEGAAYMGSAFSTGIKTAPPEGDGGTGMVATNCIQIGTANLSAGTSLFAMVVMDKELSNLHTEIDLVTTPDGKPVSMVHCNNCTSDLNAWAQLFCEFASELGISITLPEVLKKMFVSSQKSTQALSGLVNYNFTSGEPLAGVEYGVPLFMRDPKAKLSFSDFSKAQLYSSIAGIALGMDILYKEGIVVSEICGHGGFFKTPEIGQRAVSAAIGAPVSVMETAGEGGAWGMALLAALTDQNMSLEAYLNRIFAKKAKTTVSATEKERAEFLRYASVYKAGLKSALIASTIFDRA